MCVCQRIYVDSCVKCLFNVGNMDIQIHIAAVYRSRFTRINERQRRRRRRSIACTFVLDVCVCVFVRLKLILYFCLLLWFFFHDYMTHGRFIVKEHSAYKSLVCSIRNASIV